MKEFFMAKIYLKSDNLKLNVPSGTTMRSLALKSGASMVFGCRVGDCGTCAAEVLEGEKYLSPMNDKEIKLLQMMEASGRSIRFMCQCTVIAEEGEIVIDYLSGAL